MFGRTALIVTAVVAAIVTTPAMVSAGSHDHAEGHEHGGVSEGEGDGHDHGAAAAPVASGDDTEHEHSGAVPPKPYDPTQPIDLGGVEGVSPEQQARLVEMLARAGRTEDAKKEFETLRSLAADLDVRTPIYRRLADLAKGWGVNGDWRTPRPAKTDASRARVRSASPRGGAIESRSASRGASNRRSSIRRAAVVGLFRRSASTAARSSASRAPATYPITNAELRALLRGAGLREVHRVRVASLVSEGMFVVAERS